MKLAIFGKELKKNTPINIRQGKLITDEIELTSLFEGICLDLSEEYHALADTISIKKAAQELITTPPDRTRSRFIAHLDYSEWFSEYIGENQVWSCEDDVFYQIVVDNTSRVEFQEKWIKGFPDPSASKYNVNLNIGGVTFK